MALFDPFFAVEPTRNHALMALKIRLSRIGATHQPHYRIVVAETRSRRDGDAVETVGTYDPRTKGQQVHLRLDRVDYWIAKGAKPTDTLHSIIKRARRGATSAPEAAPKADAAPAAAAPAAS
jgi:small subunit ribosomal protein S16